MSIATRIAVLIGLVAVPAGAQSFDAVSIRQSKPGMPPGEKVEHGRFTANQTLFGYIQFAYDLMPSRDQMDSILAHAPKWVGTDNFEIDAREK